jgi:hypothetical protein
VKPQLLVAGAAVLALLGAPAEASAATLSASPKKACYHSEERVNLAGADFTPRSSVRFTSDGAPVQGSLTTDLTGAFGARLEVVRHTGEKVKTYTATDQTNPTVTASVRLRVSAVAVNVRPISGDSGRPRRITARGFTTGRRLYAHIRRGRFRRNLRVGTLRGACHKLKITRRLFRAGTRSGVYTLQFDTRRRYSASTPVRSRFTVTIVRSSRAQAAAQRWVRTG